MHCNCAVSKWPYAVGEAVNYSFRKASSMKPENATRVNYGIMGLILGAVLALMIGLKAGFLVAKGTADQMASAAVLKTRVAICVAQFTNAPGYQERVKDMKALSFMQRDDFIAKGGWDKMPGEEKTSDNVNRVCGDRLAELVEK